MDCATADVVGHLGPDDRQPGEEGDPGEAADQHHRRDGHEQVRRHRHQHEGQPGGHDGRAEQPVVRDPAGHPRCRAHPQGQPDEHRGEQQAVGRVPAAEAGGVQRGRADDDAARGERADDAGDQPADQRGAGHERGAVPDQGEQPGLGFPRLGGPAGDLRDAEPHRQRDHQIGQPAQRQCDVDRGQLGRRPAEQRAGAGEQREQTGRGDHGDAVGHHHGQLVGRLDLVRPAQQVGHRGVLGWDPEQRADLDQEDRDEQPPQRAHDRDGHEQREAQQVADDHHPAAVELVRQRPGHRAEHQRGQQLGRDHATEREALRLVAGGQLGGQRGQREQAQPVAGRGQRGDQPQPPERGDGQHAAHPVRGGRGQLRCARGRASGRRRGRVRCGVGTYRTSPPRALRSAGPRLGRATAVTSRPA